jgi:hypothetical protein
LCEYNSLLLTLEISQTNIVTWQHLTSGLAQGGRTREKSAANHWAAVVVGLDRILISFFLLPSTLNQHWAAVPGWTFSVSRPAAKP